MAENAAVNEKNQKKMERTMQTSCSLECRSQTEPSGTGGRGGGGRPPPSVYPSWCNRSIVSVCIVVLLLRYICVAIGVQSRVICVDEVDSEESEEWEQRSESQLISRQGSE